MPCYVCSSQLCVRPYRLLLHPTWHIAHYAYPILLSSSAADFVEAGRAEAARWRRQFVAAALLTLPVLVSSMLLPMAWPAAAAWLSGHMVSEQECAGPTASYAPCARCMGLGAEAGHTSASI